MTTQVPSWVGIWLLGLLSLVSITFFIVAVGMLIDTINEWRRR